MKITNSQALQFIIFLFILQLFSSCQSDDANAISKEWNLDLGNYINLSENLNAATTFQPELLENGLLLIHAYNNEERFLIELDPNSQQVLSTISTDGFNQLRKRKDGSILVTNYNYQTDLYSIGTYNQNNHQIDPISTIESQNINYPLQQKIINPGDYFIYTHNSNVDPNNTDEVYISKWDLNGELIWRKIFDSSSESKIYWINSIREDYIIFSTVSDYFQVGQTWKTVKLSSEGEIIWNLKLGYGSLVENEAGNLFLISDRVTKFDSNGNELWMNHFSDPKGALYYGTTTSDGGIILWVDNTKEIVILKISTTGKISWAIKYWENLSSERSMSLDFLELPNQEFIVTSLNGFITKYRIN